MDLAPLIRNVPDFPKPGIQFKDITTLLKNGPAFRSVIDGWRERYAEQRVDAVVGAEARGFMFGGALAYAGAVAVALVAGRLPAAAAVLVVLASVAAYACYAVDKSASVGDGWRIRERTLHALALAGGWPGALLAQKRLRHKVRKASFQAAFRVTVGLNCAAMLAWAAGLDDAAARLLAGLLR